jgi:hypothetical protein
VRGQPDTTITTQRKHSTNQHNTVCNSALLGPRLVHDAAARPWSHRPASALCDTHLPGVSCRTASAAATGHALLINTAGIAPHNCRFCRLPGATCLAVSAAATGMHCPGCCRPPVLTPHLPTNQLPGVRCLAVCAVGIGGPRAALLWASPYAFGSCQLPSMPGRTHWLPDCSCRTVSAAATSMQCPGSPRPPILTPHLQLPQPPGVSCRTV